MFSNNLKNNELEFTPTFGTQLAGTIETSKGEIYSIGVGDHLMIKDPVRCTWHIISPITFKSRYF